VRYSDFYALLNRACLNSRFVHVTGTASELAASKWLTDLSCQIQGGPIVVVAADTSSLDRFDEGLSFWGGSISSCRLEEMDVGPYSGLAPHRQRIGERCRWLFSALNLQQNKVLSATLPGLAQRTSPVDYFLGHCHELRIGTDLPEGFVSLLIKMGYYASPKVEDVGQYSIRGGIIDLFSPAYLSPVRIELFGDQIESARLFDPLSQRSLQSVEKLWIIPSREVSLEPEYRMAAARSIKDRFPDGSAVQEIQNQLSLGANFDCVDFLVSDFFDQDTSAVDYIPTGATILWLDSIECNQSFESFLVSEARAFEKSAGEIFSPPPDRFYEKSIRTILDSQFRRIELNRIRLEEGDESESHLLTYRTQPFRTLNADHLPLTNPDLQKRVRAKLQEFLENQIGVVVTCGSELQLQRMSHFMEVLSLPLEIVKGPIEDLSHNTIHLASAEISVSEVDLESRTAFLRDQDFLGDRAARRLGAGQSKTTSAQKALETFSHLDLESGQVVVHKDHGICIFDGLKTIEVQGIPAEFLVLRFKDQDKLYLPTYRVGLIQKFEGSPALDKLGGTAWLRTKIKVKNHLRDIASELLKLYAIRSQAEREAYPPVDEDYLAFESAFPYEETQDQLRAIDEINSDLELVRPMDRLVCGDVGFGKTEVAMRAAFRCAKEGRQVAVLVPTTVLCFQHLESFRKRFHGWPLRIESLSRFTSPADSKKTLHDLSEGKVDIVIGTHRLLSQDIKFQRLGLIVVDEEQRFGVSHKEKLRNLRKTVDTLSMSATPIPRTLNLSLSGIRDLSLIGTPPKGRLPTRTFISKYDEETIRKAILGEMERGGQIFYIHNRVQSIYSVADELRTLVPEARVIIGHGQLPERELERVMVDFYSHKSDVLLSTTIIESGLDIPRANTMIVDQAQNYGLSQLYQLRGRIGRGKDRGYCYLIIPHGRVLDSAAQERLRVLQQNSELGSGFIIAQHDLEMRGSGNLLGEEQSGFANSVGYELYMELLQEAIAELKGEEISEKTIDTEINLRIPALIPDSYIPDIKTRLYYYRKLTFVEDERDIDTLEDELRDQFGALPESTINLLGVMLIRRECQRLGVLDLSAGPKNLSLLFSPKTKIRTERLIFLAGHPNKKYAITPDNRLIVRLGDITWPKVLDEIRTLKNSLL